MKIQMQFWLSMIVLALQGFNRAISQCLPEQKTLLLQLRNNLTYDSSFSMKLLQWDEAIDCCRWRGVQCDNGGRVIGLDLSSDSMSGTIDDSSSLFRLKFLRRLSLADNYFENKALFPAGFGQLTELNYLNLSEAGFEGQIPIQFSRLSRLVTLDLSYLAAVDNPLVKLENPNLKMLVQNLTNLRELLLDGVNISTQGYNWCQALSSSLPRLQLLSLSGCNISGPLDSSLARLRSLSVIRLDGNSLFSPIPDFLAYFPNLTVLNLRGSNMLEETPQKIFQISTLRILDLSRNRELGGSLPDFPHSASLEELTLSLTKFSGNLPESLGNLRMLTTLNLDTCNFSGPIPSSLSKPSQLKFLQRLDLSGNSLGGFLPPFLFSLPSLSSLTLSNNKFFGQIGELQHVSPAPLTDIDLSGNYLEGPLPEFLFNIRGLVSLSLSSNKLTGPLELIKFSKLENLSSLDLSYNNLSLGVSGSDSDFSLLPKFRSLTLASCNLQKFPFLKNQSRMYMLDLSDNQLTGEIPNWVWELNSETVPFLNLSHNKFTGLQEPYKFGIHQYLDLHSNLLMGQIPLPPQAAAYIDFSSNKFASPIPVDFGNYLSSAILLNIANSGVVGDIPLSLCNASRLEVLDLSDNNLSSSIPSCLIESPTLEVLNLRQNKLRGNVPTRFPKDCGLETLDLSHNLLEGLVPESLANCSSLKVLNLGNNKINGSFPCWSKNLSNLRVLVLHSNSFNGDISCTEGNNSWLNLQIIDISSNNFHGILPPKFFSDLTAMVASYNSTLQLDHLHYQAWAYRVYYQDSVTLNYKGNPSEVVKILLALTSIDLSSNNFQGQIPENLGDLRSLRLLNLSNNAFTSQIPPSIGNIKNLEALDVSFNNLSGEVPQQLASLTFLAFLNLSYNQLEGRIPSGKQIQTFPESSFQGNMDLCGFPLNRTCKNITSPAPNPQPTSEKIHIYVSATIGFFVGLGVFFWPLWISKRWRKWYNTVLDSIISRIFTRPKIKYISNKKHIRFLNDDW